MLIIYTAILIIFIALTFHLTTRYNRRGRLLNKIPGPTAYPFVGNLLKFNVESLREYDDDFQVNNANSSN